MTYNIQKGSFPVTPVLLQGFIQEKQQPPTLPPATGNGFMSPSDSSPTLQHNREQRSIGSPTPGCSQSPTSYHSQSPTRGHSQSLAPRHSRHLRPLNCQRSCSPLPQQSRSTGTSEPTYIQLSTYSRKPPPPPIPQGNPTTLYNWPPLPPIPQVDLRAVHRQGPPPSAPPLPPSHIPEAHPKAGHYSTELLRMANNLQQVYDEGLTALAKEYGKLVHGIYQAIREDLTSSRQVSSWNVFEVFMAAPQGGDLQKAPDKSPQEFILYLWELYNKYMEEAIGEGWNTPNQAAARHVELASELAWYNNKLNLQLSEERMGPLTRKTIMRLLEGFAHKAQSVYQLYGLVIHGWGTDPNGDHCIEWGGSPVYERLIDTNTIQTGVVVDPAWAAILELYNNGTGKKRENHRSILVSFLVEDIRQCNGEQTKTMSWKTFADLAYTRKLRLINWPDNVVVPGVPNGLVKMTQLSGDILTDIIMPCINFIKQEITKASGKGSSKGEDDPDALYEDDLVCIISWDNGVLNF
ncbi:hypothetical protein BDP27DRAFT_1430304 [Rhodocollybia butyracea]|uniref:Uncharacterized protein n=1 Tax=Rhodocollybia butyracea TaxID=206335 RepID=A0A9P5TZC9_9AGAR|nr:hypothetical protein BDP27DRAFT_1430304 [Rhodocollybia butyracea]